MTNPAGTATLLHDAPCGLCRSTVRWLRLRDRRHRLRFVALDSAEGRELLFDAGLEPSQADSVVLLLDGRAWRWSSAVVNTLQLLGPPWPAVAWLLWLVPRPLRDLGYRTIARHRHLWPFGEVCELPGQGSRAGARASVVSTEPRSMRSATAPPSTTSRSGEASRSSKPAIESTTTTGRDASE
jgi:predicted DCC family thiol-disulfide oxidoreductase YuxK